MISFKYLHAGYFIPVICKLQQHQPAAAAITNPNPNSNPYPNPARDGFSRLPLDRSSKFEVRRIDRHSCLYYWHTQSVVLMIFGMQGVSRLL